MQRPMVLVSNETTGGNARNDVTESNAMAGGNMTIGGEVTIGDNAMAGNCNGREEKTMGQYEKGGYHDDELLFWCEKELPVP